MEEYLKKGYKLSVVADRQINRLNGALILGDSLSIEGLEELKEEDLDFLLDTNIADNLYKGKTLIATYNLEQNLFTSSIVERKYNGPYNEESYYENVVSSLATTFAGSLFKLEKGLEKGKKYVKCNRQVRKMWKLSWKVPEFCANILKKKKK